MPENKDQDRKPWHLDRTVSLSHIITTVAAIASALVFASKLDTRVSLLEQAASQQQRDVTDFKTSVRQDLRDISTKLDRLIERNK